MAFEGASGERRMRRQEGQQTALEHSVGAQPLPTDLRAGLGDPWAEPVHTAWLWCIYGVDITRWLMSGGPPGRCCTHIR